MAKTFDPSQYGARFVEKPAFDPTSFGGRFEEEQVQKPGFFGSPIEAGKKFGSDVGGAFSQAGQEMQETRGQFQRGEIGTARKLFRDVGSAGAAVSGTLGAAFGAALPQGAERGLEAAVGGAVERIPGAKPAIQATSEFLEENPDVKAGARIGMTALDVLGAGVGGKAAGKGAKFAKEGVKESLERVPTGLVTKADSNNIFKAIRPSITRKKNLKTVKKNVELASDTITEQGFKPKNLQDFSNAVEQSKKNVWAEVEKLLGESDASINLAELADDIVVKASDPNLAVVNPQVQQKMLTFAENLKERGIVSVNDAESIRQILNAELSTSFGEFAVNQVEKNIKKDFLKKLRTQVDDKISKIPGEAADLNRRYGALKQVGEDTLKRLIVAERASPANIFEQFGRISGVGEIIGGLTSLQKGVDLGRVGKGITQAVLGARAKKLGDPNELIRKAFKKAGVKKTSPKILQRLKSNKGTVNPKAMLEDLGLSKKKVTKVADLVSKPIESGTFKGMHINKLTDIIPPGSKIYNKYPKLKRMEVNFSDRGVSATARGSNKIFLGKDMWDDVVDDKALKALNKERDDFIKRYSKDIDKLEETMSLKEVMAHPLGKKFTKIENKIESLKRAPIGRKINEDGLRVLEHELQHSIQEITKKNVSKTARGADEVIDKTSDSFQKYLDDVGEVDARAAEGRHLSF